MNLYECEITPHPRPPTPRNNHFPSNEHGFFITTKWWHLVYVCSMIIGVVSFQFYCSRLVCLWFLRFYFLCYHVIICHYLCSGRFHSDNSNNKNLTDDKKRTYIAFVKKMEWMEYWYWNAQSHNCVCVSYFDDIGRQAKHCCLAA